MRTVARIEGEEHPSDAIVVERRNRIERGEHLRVGDGECGDPVAAVEIGIEARLEQLDQQRCQLGQPGHRVLDVALAEREPDLVGVLGVAAQEVGLGGGETGEQHQPVEAVRFDVTREQALERGTHVGVPSIVDHDPRRNPNPDVVHEALVSLDHELVRTFLEAA